MHEWALNLSEDINKGKCKHMYFPPAEDFIQNLKRTGKELIFYVTGDAYHCTIDKSKGHGFYRCENRLRNQIIFQECSMR